MTIMKPELTLKPLDMLDVPLAGGILMALRRGSASWSSTIYMQAAGWVPYPPEPPYPAATRAEIELYKMSFNKRLHPKVFTPNRTSQNISVDFMLPVRGSKIQYEAAVLSVGIVDGLVKVYVTPKSDPAFHFLFGIEGKDRAVASVPQGLCVSAIKNALTRATRLTSEDVFALLACLNDPQKDVSLGEGTTIKFNLDGVTP